MTPAQRLKVVGATTTFTVVLVAGMLLSSPQGRADDRAENSDSRIEGI